MTGPANEENAVVYYDLGTGAYFHLIAPGQARIGHLDGLMTTADSLFLSDLMVSSFFGPPYNMGAVYQVASVPEPGLSLMVGCGALALAVIGRRT